MMGQATLQKIHTSLIDIRDRLSNLKCKTYCNCFPPSRSEALVTGPSDMMGQATLQKIHTSLIDIRDRLSNLNLSAGQSCETKADDNGPSEVVKREADDVKNEKLVKETKAKEANEEQSKPSADKRQVDPLHELFQRKLALALEECYPDLPSPGKPNSERDPSEESKNKRKVKFKGTQDNTGDEEADDKQESPSREGRNCYIQFRGPNSYRYFRYGAPYLMGDARWSRGAYPPDGYPYMPFQPPPPPFGPHQVSQTPGNSIFSCHYQVYVNLDTVYYASILPTFAHYLVPVMTINHFSMLCISRECLVAPDLRFRNSVTMDRDTWRALLGLVVGEETGHRVPPAKQDTKSARHRGFRTLSTNK
ncbi:hypothetical protein T265_12609, partial [Opisthorchis viverrini]